jgi:hypothetical protein
MGVGVDISAGTGASNTTAAFGNIETGEKVAEYASPNIKPEAFSKLLIAMCKYFNDAFMVPDGGGPGRITCDELIRLGYRNLYYRRNEEGLSKKVSDKPGVFLNPKEKAAVFGIYRRKLKDRTFIQRSSLANQECLQYIFTTGNKIEHSSALNSIDPSGAGESHGDRVVADVLLAKCYEFLGPKKVQGKGEKQQGPAPARSFAGRKRAQMLKERKSKEW